MGKDKSLINLQYDRQSQENAIDRQWQSDEWQRQFQQQIEQQNAMFEKESQRWQDQFNLQNEYNTPVAQMKRLQAAGINGAAAVNAINGGSSSGGLSSASGASSPSPSQSPSRSIGGASIGNSDAMYFSSLGQLADSLGKLGVYGSETSATQRKVQVEIDKIISEKNLNDTQAALNGVLADIQKTYGKDRVAAEIASMLSQSFAYQYQLEFPY